MNRAENGDMRALDYLLKVSGAAPAEPASIVVNQFFDNNNPAERTIAVASIVKPPGPIEAISNYLACMGPAQPEEIARGTELEVSEVIGILDSTPARFRTKGKLYYLPGQRV